MNLEMQKECAYHRLMRAINSPGVKKRLPGKPMADKGAFRPMHEVTSPMELAWVLDYIVRAYEGRVRLLPQERNGYLIFLDSVPLGHPIFLLGTLYVLMSGGARIHARYDSGNDDLYGVLLDALTESGDVTRLVPADPYSHDEVIRYFHTHSLSHLVPMGDAVNSHTILPLARSLGDIRLHFPSAYLLITDYLEEPVFTDKLSQFGSAIWAESIDYDGYRAVTNQAEDVYFGFDYGDLFWNADAVVNSFLRVPAMQDKIACLIFTDHPQTAWLPEGIEKCCIVKYFNDDTFDPFYPVYDFTQLLGCTPISG